MSDRFVLQINDVQWAGGSAYAGTENLTEKKAAPVDWDRVEREKTPFGKPPPDPGNEELS